MKRITLGLLACLSTSALAQQSIKPRPLGAVQATSKELLGSATLARQLPNGSVIVNDASKRRLMLLDPTLQSFSLIADSTSGAANSYGQRPGGLLPYVADSTLYLDVTAGSLLVIDPSGKVARVMSPPRPSDNNYLVNSNFGYPGFDAQGRMIYRSAYPRQLQQTRDGGIQSAPAPDSAPIIRVNLDTRKADTIGVVKLAKTLMTSTTIGGMTMMMGSQAPLQSIDDWALLSDGSVAVLRGRDYHIDWINADGTKKTTDRIAFDWQRLNDDQKLAIIDSISKARASAQSAPGGGAPMMMFGDGGGMSVMYRGGDGGGRGGNVTVDRTMVAGAAAAAAATGTPPTPPPASATPASSAKPGDSTAKATPAPASNASNSNSSASVTPAGSSVDNKVVAADRAGIEMKGAAMGGGMPGMPGMPGGIPGPPLPAASDLPDYMPPFMNSSARPDADAHVWVRTTTPGATAGNVVYDVINNKGELIDRVDVPKGMSIVGFGKGGIVYLTQREAYSVRLVRATIH